MIARKERRSGLDKRKVYDPKRERRSYAHATDPRWNHFLDKSSL